jgi:hypothetical protein
MSIANVVVCDRAVFKHIETHMHHGLEIALRGIEDHAHEAASTCSLLDLFFSVTLKVLADCVDVKLMIRGRVSPRRIVVNISVIDQKMSRLSVLFQINNVEARMELQDPMRGINHEDSLPIVTVIRDLIFLA